MFEKSKGSKELKKSLYLCDASVVSECQSVPGPHVSVLLSPVVFILFSSA